VHLTSIKGVYTDQEFHKRCQLLPLKTLLLEVGDLRRLPLQINGKKIKTNIWSHAVELVATHTVDDDMWQKMVGIT